MAEVCFGKQLMKRMARMGAVKRAVNGRTCPRCRTCLWDHDDLKGLESAVGWIYIDTPKNVPGAVVEECPECRQLFMYWVLDEFVYRWRKQGHPLFAIIGSHEFHTDLKHYLETLNQERMRMRTG